ncbi:MAG: hypothetical protein R3C39_13505 [Dehalococcoidia bacterium]
MRVARLLLVLSSISPLFILWAVRGSDRISDAYFVPACVLAVLVPNAFLWLRIRTAVKLRETRELVIGRADDQRDHLLVYLFTMLLPLYTASVGTWRDISAALVALGFIVFLFWHLNLHYMNLAFAICGYRVFTIYAPDDGNSLTDRSGIALITRRESVAADLRVTVYRLSNTVYLERQQ